MSQRQRSHQRNEAAPLRPGDDEGAGLDAARADVNRLNSVVDKAYDQIRSVNSEEYLRQNRQSGGQ